MTHVINTNEHNGYGFYVDTDEQTELTIPTPILYNKPILKQLKYKNNTTQKYHPFINLICCVMEEPLKYVCITITLSCGLVGSVVWFLY